jgi:hypothetical protein
VKFLAALLSILRRVNLTLRGCGGGRCRTGGPISPGARPPRAPPKSGSTWSVVNCFECRCGGVFLGRCNPAHARCGSTTSLSTRSSILPRAEWLPNSRSLRPEAFPLTLRWGRTAHYGLRKMLPTSRPHHHRRDGALWFTAFFVEKIGRVTAAGMITEFPLSPGSGWPRRITTNWTARCGSPN